MRGRDWLFGRRALGGAGADAGVLLLRVVPMLLLFALHGVGKTPPGDQLVGWIGSMGFPAPALFAWLAALAEAGAALLILVGLMTRPAALYVFVHFVIVVLVAHSGDALSDRELPMLFGTIALSIALIGPGRYSIDAVLLRRASTAEARVAARGL